jgi:hypothetical protein
MMPVIAVALAAACAPVAPPAPLTPVPVARLDHAPTGCAAPSSMKLTLAIVAPTWQPPASATAPTAAVVTSQVTPGMAALQGKFRTALRDDFLEIITCRGYLSKGPFESFDVMVFPEREGSDLLLEPVIESTMALIDVRPTASCKGFLGKTSCTLDAASGAAPTSFTLNGAIQLGGRVTLTLREPVTNTRMWTKSVEMPAERVPFTGETVYTPTSRTAPPDAWADRGVQTALAPALERAYRAVLQASDGYLNVRELQLVATQAADVRRKASISVPR